MTRDTTDTAEVDFEVACHGPLFHTFMEPDAAYVAAMARRELGKSSMAALGLSFMQMPVCLAHLEELFALQQPDGRVPCTRDGRGVALPLFGTVVRLVFFQALEHNKDLLPRLVKIARAIERFHAFLERESKGHLFFVQPGDERLVSGPGSDVPDLADIAFNTILVQAETDLADMAVHTSIPTQEVMVRRTRRAQAIIRRMWSDSHGKYLSRQGAGFFDAPVVDGLLPMYAGLATPGQAREMISRYVTREGGFWSPYPLATLIQDSSDFDPHRLGWGPVDPLVNWLMIQGLYRYGLDAQAYDLNDKFLEMVRLFSMFDQFDPHEGKGLGAEYSPITASIALELSRAPCFVKQQSNF